MKTLSDLPAPQALAAPFTRAEHRRHPRGLRHPAVRYIATAAVYIAAYIALDWTSEIRAWSPLRFTLWNPPPALSLALIIVRGPAYIVLIFPAELLAEYVVRGAVLGPVFATLSALIVGIGYGALGMALRRLGPFDLLQGGMRAVASLLVLLPAGILAIAALYAGTFVGVGILKPEHFLRAVRAFWTGDVTGILALLPFLLVLATPGRLRDEMRSATLDLGVFAVALAIALWLIYVGGTVTEIRFFYLLFIPIIWIAVRRGMAGAAIGVLAVQLTVVTSLLLRSYPPGTFLNFQTFLLIIGATGLLLGALVTARSQAELRLRKQQAELDQVARMMTVGVMGSALAHEIGQPLASIASYARASQMLLASGSAPSQRVTSMQGQILAETERAGQVLRRLRDILVHGRTDPQHLDIGEVVGKVVALLSRQPIAAHVDIAASLSNLPRIVADPLQIEQVLMNIASNAVEATAETTPGGTVRVVARGLDGMAEIAIEDEGPGLTPELAKSMFEPFVTTKENGMGLGLAICRTLADLNGWRLDCANLPNGGARFAIRIPSAGKTECHTEQ
jgi:signal transduction histidine kinase